MFEITLEVNRRIGGSYLLDRNFVERRLRVSSFSKLDAIFNQKGRPRPHQQSLEARVRSGKTQSNESVSCERAVFQKVRHVYISLRRSTRSRIVPSIRFGRPDESVFEIVNAFVNDHQIWRQIQHTRFKVDEIFPRRPA